MIIKDEIDANNFGARVLKTDTIISHQIGTIVERQLLNINKKSINIHITHSILMHHIWTMMNTNFMCSVKISRVKLTDKIYIG